MQKYHKFNTVNKLRSAYNKCVKNTDSTDVGQTDRQTDTQSELVKEYRIVLCMHMNADAR